MSAGVAQLFLVKVVLVVASRCRIICRLKDFQQITISCCGLCAS